MGHRFRKTELYQPRKNSQQSAIADHRLAQVRPFSLQVNATGPAAEAQVVVDQKAESWRLTAVFSVFVLNIYVFCADVG